MLDRNRLLVDRLEHVFKAAFVLLDFCGQRLQTRFQFQVFIADEVVLHLQVCYFLRISLPLKLLLGRCLEQNVAAAIVLDYLLNHWSPVLRCQHWRLLSQWQRRSMREDLLRLLGLNFDPGCLDSGLNSGPWLGQRPRIFFELRLATPVSIKALDDFPGLSVWFGALSFRLEGALDWLRRHGFIRVSGGR